MMIVSQSSRTPHLHPDWTEPPNLHPSWTMSAAVGKAVESVTTPRSEVILWSVVITMQVIQFVAILILLMRA